MLIAVKTETVVNIPRDTAQVPCPVSFLLNRKETLSTAKEKTCFNFSKGYITKFNREQLDLPKTHYYDANYVAAGDSTISKTCNHYYVKKLISKGDYQQTKGAHSEGKCQQES